MYEKPKLNTQESTFKNKEVFKDVGKIDSKENPRNDLSKLVEKRKEDDRVAIDRLTRELKGASAVAEKLPVENEITTEEITQRISDERGIYKLGQEQQQQKERYTVGPEEQGILAWEDKVKKAQETIDIAESRLALGEAEFKEMFGELADTMRESIPRTIEENRKRLEDYTSIAKGLREKNNQ